MTVKIHCFSAINGEKTFVWNGLGELQDGNRMIFRTDQDEYRFSVSSEDALFERFGELPLDLFWNRSGTGKAHVSANGHRLTLRMTILSFVVEFNRFEVSYQIEGQTETHAFHLTWT